MSWLLSGLGSLVENSDPPAHADVILVLGGDASGNRILKGAELARLGYAPIVLVSYGEAEYGQPEAEMAKSFAVQHGYSPDLFVVTDWDAHSTVEEAHAAIAEMRRRGVRKAIVVTTIWHTARAARIFRRNAREMTFYMVGSDDADWHRDHWWTGREGRKTFFMESIKTIADFLGV